MKTVRVCKIIYNYSIDDKNLKLITYKDIYKVPTKKVLALYPEVKKLSSLTSKMIGDYIRKKLLKPVKKKTVKKPTVLATKKKES